MAFADDDPWLAKAHDLHDSHQPWIAIAEGLRAEYERGLRDRELVADPLNPGHEEAVRVLLELGWDLGHAAPAGEENPFRRPDA